MLHLRGDNDGAQLSSRQKVHVRDYGHICYVESCACVNLFKKTTSFLEGPLILRYKETASKDDSLNFLFWRTVSCCHRRCQALHERGPSKKPRDVAPTHMDMQVLQMAHKKSSKIGLDLHPQEFTRVLQTGFLHCMNNLKVPETLSHTYLT